MEALYLKYLDESQKCLCTRLGFQFESLLLDPVLLTIGGARIAHWQCVGLAVLFDAVLWVQSSGKIFFPVEGIFPLELT